MVTTKGCHENNILIFDSLYDDVDAIIKSDVKKIFPEGISCYQMPPVPKQDGPVDCGLYAVSYATHKAYRRDPHKLTTHHFNHELMRHHLVKCFEQGHLTEFP